MRLLLIDIGNTNIKSAIFSDGILNNFLIHTSDINFFEYLEKLTPGNVAISSVVPPITKKVSEKLKQLSLPSPFIISSNSNFNLKIKYSTPDSLGVDRICSAEGAYKTCSENKILEKLSFILSIDFGTATTVNVTTASGDFLGGIIAPGIDTMFKSLNSKTAQLPVVSISNYKDIIGKDTISAIASGIVNSTKGMIDLVIRNLEMEQPDKKLMCFITGGNAAGISDYLSNDFILDEKLILKGIKEIYYLNQLDTQAK